MSEQTNPPLNEESFSFSMPCEIVKSESDDLAADKPRKVRGLASSEKKDLQNEIILKRGLKLDYFLQEGWLNDNHRSGPEFVVGTPTSAKITDKGLEIEGVLLKNHPRADYWWQLLNSLETSNSNRKVKLSIEGKVTKRSNNVIKEAFIQNISLTLSPVNTDTYLDIAKSLSAQKWCSNPLAKSCNCESGDGLSCDLVKEHDSDCACKKETDKGLTAGGMGSALIPESLEQKAKVTTYKSLEEFTFENAVGYLQEEHGYSQRIAKAIADSIFISLGRR